jgi:hypothetical protein
VHRCFSCKFLLILGIEVPTTASYSQFMFTICFCFPSLTNELVTRCFTHKDLCSASACVEERVWGRADKQCGADAVQGGVAAPEKNIFLHSLICYTADTATALEDPAAVLAKPSQPQEAASSDRYVPQPSSP